MAVVKVCTRPAHNTCGINAAKITAIISVVINGNFAADSNIFYSSAIGVAEQRRINSALCNGQIAYAVVCAVKSAFVRVAIVSDRSPFFIIQIYIRGQNSLCGCRRAVVHLCGEPRKLFRGADLVNAALLRGLGNGGAVPAFAALGVCFGGCCFAFAEINGVQLLSFLFAGLLGQRFFLLLFLRFNLLKLNRVNFVRQCRYGAKADDHHHRQKQR